MHRPRGTLAARTIAQVLRRDRRPRRALALRHAVQPDRRRRPERDRQVDAAAPARRGRGAGLGCGHARAAGPERRLPRPGARGRGLSGGEAARRNLEAILAADADVLLLDEPTNDLDFAGLELLERFLASHRGGVVAVSHDRAFLERMTSIVELEAETRRVRVYAGRLERVRRASARPLASGTSRRTPATSPSASGSRSRRAGCGSGRSAATARGARRRRRRT